MGRSKQNKQNQKKEKGSDGKQYRKETKEERKERLRLQEEAREQCFKMLPYAGGAIVVFILIFALWVRSVPAAAPKPKIEAVFDLPQSRPEDDPALKAALKEAQEALNQAQEMNDEVTQEGEAAAASETIEL